MSAFRTDQRRLSRPPNRFGGASIIECMPVAIYPFRYLRREGRVRLASAQAAVLSDTHPTRKEVRVPVFGMLLSGCERFCG